MGQLSMDKRKKRSKRIALICCIVSFLSLSAIISYLVAKNANMKNMDISHCQKEIQIAVNEIGKFSKELKGVVSNLAEELTDGKIKKSEVVKQLSMIAKNNPQIQECGVAFAPYAYNSDTRLYAPYYTRVNGETVFGNLEKTCDYTEKKYDWYNTPRRHGPTWKEPYYDKNGKYKLVEYEAPFFKIDPLTKKKEFIGIVYANYSLSNLRKIITSLDLGQTGYGFLLSKEGRFLFHPLKGITTGSSTIYRLMEKENFKYLSLVAEKLKSQSKGYVDFIDPITKEEAFLFFQPVSNTGWFAAIIVYPEEVFTRNPNYYSILVWLSLNIILFLFFLTILITRVWEGDVKKIWIVSIVLSLLLIGEIGFNWYLAFEEVDYNPTAHVEIDSRTGFQSFLNERIQLSEMDKTPPPVTIPTGVFIRTIKFQDANNILISGNIWQKYIKGMHDGISRGFLMPDALTATDLCRWEEIYHIKQGAEEVIGWYFEIDLRQNFDYSRYPFDKIRISLKILPKDIDKNIFLAPDIGSYSSILPRSKPGLMQNLVLPGREINKSFFDYSFENYETNFGINNYIGQYYFPELNYTIVISRSFVSVFVANFMSCIVIAILMFVIQLIVRPKMHSDDGGKFSALEIISIGAGMIFIILLEHINLRSHIIGGGIIYLEYLYFSIYFIIVFITLNALLISLGFKFWLISYKENLLPKVLYWPLLLLLILIVTLFCFSN
jgi:hypothetical protein